jgi:hypothetical protein
MESEMMASPAMPQIEHLLREAEEHRSLDSMDHDEMHEDDDDDSFRHPDAEDDSENETGSVDEAGSGHEDEEKALVLSSDPLSAQDAAVDIPGSSPNPTVGVDVGAGGILLHPGRRRTIKHATVFSPSLGDIVAPGDPGQRRRRSSSKMPAPTVVLQVPAITALEDGSLNPLSLPEGSAAPGSSMASSMQRKVSMGQFTSFNIIMRVYTVLVIVVLIMRAGVETFLTLLVTHEGQGVVPDSWRRGENPLIGAVYKFLGLGYPSWVLVTLTLQFLLAKPFVLRAWAVGLRFTTMLTAIILRERKRRLTERTRDGLAAEDTQVGAKNRRICYT